MDALQRDSDRLSSLAGGSFDLAIVLGSGLSDALEGKAAFERIPYAQLESVPKAHIAGHRGEALVGEWHGKRVLAFAGRVHLYQGFDARAVTSNVALAALAGAKTIVLTNAAGALNPSYEPGDLMLIADHINVTGTNPLAGQLVADPFVDMLHAYSPRLRALAREHVGGTRKLQEGIYASVLGPSYETPAEARFLRSIGADAVGMSTVLETILARHRGMEVLGVSLITNSVGAPEISHHEVTRVAGDACARLGELIDGVVLSGS